jgi:hypothetical protein
MVIAKKGDAPAATFNPKDGEVNSDDVPLEA